MSGRPETYGGYKVCRQCGKVFYVLRPELWVYKRDVIVDGDHVLGYFHTYSCKRKFDAEYDKKLVDGRSTCHVHQRKQNIDKCCSDCRYPIKGKYGFYDCAICGVAVKMSKHACGRFKPKYEDADNAV